VPPVNATETSGSPEQSVQYLLDTNAASAHQREQTLITARIAEHPAGSVGTTAVTMYEQFRGRFAVIDRARDVESLTRAYSLLEVSRLYFCTMPVLSFDEAAARIYRGLLPIRLRTGTQDLRIAAIALANDVVLVTSNRRDFDRVPGLRIEDWNAA
jgi:tRNA(fMet)-specific endonuclease VapC